MQDGLELDIAILGGAIAKTLPGSGIEFVVEDEAPYPVDVGLLALDAEASNAAGI